MTGPEHYIEAERLLEEANDVADYGVNAVVAHIGLAQAHATLAHAAATALGSDLASGMPEQDREAWRRAASAAPERTSSDDVG